MEFYQDIIHSLVKRSLTIDSLAYECDMDCIQLQQRLDFLVNHDLLSIEISRDNKNFYVLTRRGLAISKTFSVTKRLEKLQANQQTEISQIAALSEPRRAKIKRVR